MENLNFLTDDDVKCLKELVSWRKSQYVNARIRTPHIPLQDQTPDVYIAWTQDGIPAMTGPAENETGTSSGIYDTDLNMPGEGLCTIFRVLRISPTGTSTSSGSTEDLPLPALYPIGQAPKTVLNLSGTAIKREQFIVINRDKFGNWIAQSPSSGGVGPPGPPGGTITVTGNVALEGSGSVSSVTTIKPAYTSISSGGAGIALWLPNDTDATHHGVVNLTVQQMGLGSKLFQGIGWSPSTVMVTGEGVTLSGAVGGDLFGQIQMVEGVGPGDHDVPYLAGTNFYPGLGRGAASGTGVFCYVPASSLSNEFADWIGAGYMLGGIIDGGSPLPNMPCVGVVGFNDPNTHDDAGSYLNMTINQISSTGSDGGFYGIIQYSSHFYTSGTSSSDAAWSSNLSFVANCLIFGNTSHFLLESLLASPPADYAYCIVEGGVPYVGKKGTDIVGNVFKGGLNVGVGTSPLALAHGQDGYVNTGFDLIASIGGTYVDTGLGVSIPNATGGNITVMVWCRWSALLNATAFGPSVAAYIQGCLGKGTGFVGAGPSQAEGDIAALVDIGQTGDVLGANTSLGIFTIENGGADVDLWAVCLSGGATVTTARISYWDGVNYQESPHFTWVRVA